MWFILQSSIIFRGRRLQYPLAMDSEFLHPCAGRLLGLCLSHIAPEIVSEPDITWLRNNAPVTCSEPDRPYLRCELRKRPIP